MRLFDERFLMHRLRSSTIMGITGGVLATGLWLYHFLADHRWDWELFAIAATMAAVKQGAMLWYRLRH